MDQKSKKGNLPPQSVIDAFGAQCVPVLLEGGQNKSFRVGNTVLKADEFVEEEAVWIAHVYETIKQIGFRLPQPIRTKNGDVLYEGWSAWEYVEARHIEGCWKDLFAVSDAFHAALRKLERPHFLDTIQNRWIIADRKVWNDRPMEYNERLGKLVQQLLSVMHPIALPSQVIHGDFGGNVLFAKDGGSPYIIDFSPYFRPAGFAKAIIAIDALTWEHADESILQYISHEQKIYQLLIRAALRRILELDGALRLDGIDIMGEADAYRKTVNIICEKAKIQN